ncbi:hypothetical protein KFL_001520120 [Klebsormidium nitens]|uniref:Uncharacterized protein n=1 Tax=Klebsormidium nitens TaxID=105231 RepID=A0A1Y1I0Q1_KLENI|nr:hypothetical protein KFL_001520120 [Klebsormidium nitens]|eukprot:GAQ83542.1 hypothetical protein KFL_001520120 [Klebsormidium nitens]
MPGERHVSTAATQIGDRGIAKGVRPRASLSEAAESSEEVAPTTSIKAQAVRYLRMMVSPEAPVHMFLPTDSETPRPLRLYLSPWDHNGEGRPKALGKPDKVNGLPVTVWWNTLGKLCCTCNRGRLTEDAACVHKLALAALSESWAPTSELPTREMLGRGARVERVATDDRGSCLAVAENVQGALGPRRRMVFQGFDKKKGVWLWCQGKNDGCPSMTECSHIAAARRALSEAGGIPVANQIIMEPSQPLSMAALCWVERWDGVMPQSPGVGLSEGQEGESALREEEEYLIGLLEKRPHEPAKCSGESCFCRQHERLFGMPARAPSKERVGGSIKRGSGLLEGTCLRERERGAARRHGQRIERVCSRLRQSVGKGGRQRTRGARRRSGAGPPRCGGSWVEAWVEASVTAASWSQGVRTRVYHCQCQDEAHAIHFDGEHLGLYAWNRRTIFVQESLQLLLRGMQHGHSFKAELARDHAAFQRSPDAVVPSEETWRRASLDFFKLVGLGIRDCCSICGPHPRVLLCDGIVGLASSDGARKPGGLGSSTLDARRTFTHPSRDSAGQLFEKRSISGRDYCGAGLEGGGLKRKLLLQPELREAIARLSQNRPKDEKLGQRLSRVEFEGLLDGLAHEDARIVKRFGPGEAEGPLPEDGRRRLLVEQQTMVRDRNLAVFELLTGIQADFQRRGRNPNLWESWVGEWTELLYSLGAHDADEDLIGSGALHVVKRLLLGGEATLEDRRDLARDAPILRRLLDAYGGSSFPTFFFRTLHELYLLALLSRGAAGFEGEGRLGWIHEAIQPFDRAVTLLREAKARPLSIEERRQLDDARGLANELLRGVEKLKPSSEQWGRMSAAERLLLRERLGKDENGGDLQPLPVGHSFREEQDTLACYSLPGWEQKRGLPYYSNFEHPDGRSRTSEEFKCATGKSMTEWDAEHVPGLVKGAGKLSGKKGSKSKRPKRCRGAFVFCCSHRVIYGFHIMLRGESLRDAFTVLYTRLRREDLPEVLVHDNACALRNYSMRRAPAFFRDVRFVVDRFHFSKAGQEVHKCGPSNSADAYDALHWVNTSAVESVNSFLKGFRSLGWYSGLESLMVILPLLLGGFNTTLKRVDNAKRGIAIAAAAWSAAIARALLQG